MCALFIFNFILAYNLFAKIMLSCSELLELQHRLENPPPPKWLTTFYLRDEVALHNAPNDVWVIVNGRVLELNTFLAKPDVFQSPPIEELLAYAGKDLSHYFTKNNTPQTRISVHGTTIPTLAATTVGTRFATSNSLTRYSKDHSHANNPMTYWWDSTEFEIGRITTAERPLRLINTLTMNSVHMTVCEEDTIHDIRRKYNKRFNTHSGSYTWRKTFRNKRCDQISGRLDFNRTLTGNSLLKGLPPNDLPTAIWLFYDDDFTIT